MTATFGDELGDWLQSKIRDIPDEVALSEYTKDNPPPPGYEWYITNRAEENGKISYAFELREVD